jgi:hypothetical protein
VAQSPEEELADFLNALPSYMQKVLWYDYSQMSLREWADHHYGTSGTKPLAESDRSFFEGQSWKPDMRRFNEVELRARFEQILQRCDPAKWESYYRNAKIQRAQTADRVIPIPRRNRGRKANDELAERIWALDAEGKKNEEIRAELNASGENLSLEAVESYLKKRRRRPAR